MTSSRILSESIKNKAPVLPGAFEFVRYQSRVGNRKSGAINQLDNISHDIQRIRKCGLAVLVNIGIPDALFREFSLAEELYSGG